MFGSPLRQRQPIALTIEDYEEFANGFVYELYSLNEDFAVYVLMGFSTHELFLFSLLDLVSQ